MDYSPPGSSVHGILQARTLQWAVIPFPRGPSRPGNCTRVSGTASRSFTAWASRDAPKYRHGWGKRHQGLMWVNGNDIFQNSTNPKCPLQRHAGNDEARTSQPHYRAGSQQSSLGGWKACRCLVWVPLTLPPMSGSTCIFPATLSFTDDTIRQVPHRMTWRLVHRFTGKCILPLRTLYIPESWIRSELPVLWGLPTTSTSKQFSLKETGVLLLISRADKVPGQWKRTILKPSKRWLWL